MRCLECWQDSGLEDFSAPFCSERAWNQLITMGPCPPVLTRFVEMSTSLVFACLSGRLELEDLFFFRKKKTNAKQGHLTESSRRISMVRHHFSASQRIAAYLRGHFQRIPKRTPKRTPKHPKPKPREIPVGSLGLPGRFGQVRLSTSGGEPGPLEVTTPVGPRGREGLQGNC